ncbi:hypothetical protein [Chondromyces apiculatus]|uniref:Uncharacterized protein n=1 Tax=Chondromyces apiculatus DSM 436 TaxID=1192034 RepID=A0A017THA4_9BACT|nr:hypothetical protein [Chondromyces apiculatus]EYF08648.1 Hypothetical protein CAP_2508 [Chondromyces apiculatus DSM 436]
MATKIEDFLKEKKLDPRRILAASAEIERSRPEDRAIKLAQRKARKSEDKKKEGLAAKKPRSGRPVTQRSLDAAIGGKPLSGPAKTRLLRAVNKLLEQKKQEPVTLHALFDLPKKGGAEKASSEEAS